MPTSPIPPHTDPNVAAAAKGCQGCLALVLGAFAILFIVGTIGAAFTCSTCEGVGRTVNEATIKLGMYSEPGISRRETIQTACEAGLGSGPCPDCDAEYMPRQGGY